MTLTTPYQASFYVGDGETKAFPFVFEELSDNFVKVIVSHIDGTISIPTYTVDLDLKQVVFGDETPAPTADDVVCIYRETPTIQDTPFKTLEGYNAKALENILSKIVAMIQEIKSNYFSTQVLQGDPWQLDLLKSADDGATVNIDYTAKKLVKGLYFQISNGNLQVSADGSSYITMPKSSDVAELRQQVITLPDLTVIKKLQYRVNNEWFDAETNAQATADAALALAQSVQSTLSGHLGNTNNPHSTSLNNLTDTDIDTPTAGNFIMFDGLKWKNVNSSATASWGTLMGDITTQSDLMDKFTEYVRTDGSSTMTGVLKMRATSSFQCAIAPFWDGVGFYKLNSDDSVTLIASIETPDGFVPWVTNTYNIGSSLKKWKNLYLAGKAYMSVINNGYDIAIPVTNSADTFALLSDIAFKSTDVELTSPSNGQFLMYDGSKWINSTQGYANTDLGNLTATGEAKFTAKANTNMDNLTSTGKANISAQGTYDSGETYSVGTIGKAIQNKANVDMDNLTATGKEVCANMAMPSDTYDNLTVGASGSSYVAPADGYFVVAITDSGYAELTTTSTSSTASFVGGWARAFIPVKKGKVMTLYYGNVRTWKIFRFYYAQGAQ